jgi:hypothetical protein
MTSREWECVIAVRHVCGTVVYVAPGLAPICPVCKPVQLRECQPGTDISIAAIQRRIERVLKSKGSLGRCMLYKLTNGKRVGTVNWDKALEGLVRGGLAGRTEGKFFWEKPVE